MNKVFTNPLDYFKKFTQTQAFGGLLLIFCTAIALLIANSGIGHSYLEFWHLHFTIGFGDALLDKSLSHWINDGLMAMFFFVVGLEIKREIYVGELSEPGKAALPVFAAIGGIVVPAFIYYLLNPLPPTNEGWGVPMATDIAFTLGVLSLFGKRVPIALKVFLTALAIVDDLGAVIIIAFFYSSSVSLGNLAIAAVFLGGMLLGNYLGVKNKFFYAILGIGGLWLAFMLSGIHATIAGVLAALAIPTSSKLNLTGFRDSVQNLLGKSKTIHTLNSDFLSKEEHVLVDKVKKACKDYEPPLQRLEHYLHPIVIYIIMPLFVLANAGIVFSNEMNGMFTDTLTWGIVLGLVIGKPLGIIGASFLATRIGNIGLPKDVSWKHIIAGGFMAGIGFTMSIFISNLAFSDPANQEIAKAAILIGSLIAGIIGFLLMQWATRKNIKTDQSFMKTLKS